MFKLDRKLIIASIGAISLLASNALASNSLDCNSPASKTYENGKRVIDGGVYYPVVNGKTSVYRVNTKGEHKDFNYGRTPTKNELKAWNTDVTPTSPPPEGSGSVEEGEEIYEEQCVMCHGDFGSGGGGYPSLSKGNAYEGQKTLTNNRMHDPEADGPIRVFGTYWPQASTLWWYIQAGMPHPHTKSLSDDETYALVAYIMNINEMEIDGEELDDEYVLDREKFLKIKMPNVDGFEPKIDGPKGTDNVRAYFDNPKNFGAQKVDPKDRCMKNCQKKSAKITRIKGVGIADFLPPMSVKRDLPESKAVAKPGQSEYEASCAVCHGASGMGAPVVGNKDEWAVVMKKGNDAVYKNAINGVGGMPPKGGTDLSDAKLKEIIDYMYNASK